VWANVDAPAFLPEEAADIHAVSHDRVRDLVSRFRDGIDFWDVVNEPSLLAWANPRYGAWAQWLGSQAFMSQHLHTARAANPAATLAVESRGLPG
jgi:GH35 family endo-1,4-beta-xylanase